MNDLRLRGYVTPEDFTGSETEKLQQALNFAAESDIRKVVLTGTYRADAPLRIPANMYILLEGTLYADLQNEKICNFAFEQDRIYIRGGRIVGDLSFYHARHVILEALQIQGSVSLEFARDLRFEDVSVTGKLTLGRGCANVIGQKLQLGACVLTSQKGQADIPGREPTLRNILLRDIQVTDGICLSAAEDFGLINIQIDHSCAAHVTVGQPDAVLPAQLYTNFTLSELSLRDGVILHNACRNSHIFP